MHSTHAGTRILAVATLYRQPPAKSHALISLTRILKEDPELATHFALLVYDNSPASQELPFDFPLHYAHDPANGGLAAAYNYALANAESAGYEWLLLLDQDTKLTRSFLRELIACAQSVRAQDHVTAIVPKLMVHGVIQSPAEHFIDYMRHQFTRSLYTLNKEVGVQPGRISAYNSGSALYVPALRLSGGFPTDFWLDYLDHAVFHQLSARGGQVYVLPSVLEHDLAESDLHARPIWRFRNVLAAQTLFVKRTGNFLDRLLYRVWLLRSIRRLRADLHDKRVWRETALQALLLSTRRLSAPVRSTPRGLHPDEPERPSTTR